VLGRRPHEVAKLGVGRTFQTTEHFKSFTALDYVLLGRHNWLPHSALVNLVPARGLARREAEQRAVVTRMAASVGIDTLLEEPIAELPYGIQKLLDLIRAAATESDLLLLDEPTSGLPRRERPLVSELLQSVRRPGQATLLVDHDVEFVVEHCDRLLVMNFGRSLGLGDTKELLRNPEVIAAYLGAAR
jgi:branched-chain amino acid transport system ATP-binding protein